MHGSSLHGNREISRLATKLRVTDTGKALRAEADDARTGEVRLVPKAATVPGKPTNKAGRPAAEPVQGRGGAKGNADLQSTHRTRGGLGPGKRVTGAGPRTSCRKAG